VSGSDALRSRCRAAVAALVWAGVAGTACEGGFGERGGRAFECSSAARVTHLRDVHYPGESCDEAIAKAELHLTAAYFRKACQQLAPSAPLPRRVRDAYVSFCEPASEREGFERGAVIQVDICCP
jgi:hypothetical protein